MFWPRDLPAFDRAALKADPVFALRLPGSTELLEVGSDARAGIDGSVPAFAGHIFGSALASSDVYAYYEREIAKLGWRTEPPPYARSTTELETRVYCRTGVILRLAIDDKAKKFDPSFYQGRDYATVFDATLIANDPKLACPRVPATPFPSVTR